MVNNNEYKLNSIVQFKKPHPSGTVDWKVVRLGADIKVQSTIKQDLYIMMDRKRFNNKVVKVIKL